MLWYDWMGAMRNSASGFLTNYAAVAGWWHRALCGARVSPTIAQGSWCRARRRCRSLGWHSGFGKVASEARQRVAGQQAAGALSWIGAHDSRRGRRPSSHTRSCSDRPGPGERSVAHSLYFFSVDPLKAWRLVMRSNPMGRMFS